MSEPSSVRRWFQFDLRTLLLIVTIVAVWLAWRYAPPPKPESPIAKSLKVGDQVMIQESGGMYTVAIQDDPPRHSRHVLWSRTRTWRPLRVEYVDDEIVRLRDSDQTEVLRVSRIARVVRFDAAPPPHTHDHGGDTTAAGGMPFGAGAAGDGDSSFDVTPGSAGGAPRAGRTSPSGFGITPNPSGDVPVPDRSSGASNPGGTPR